MWLDTKLKEILRMPVYIYQIHTFLILRIVFYQNKCVIYL